MGLFVFNGNISGNAMADFMLGEVYQFDQGGGEYKELYATRWGSRSPGHHGRSPVRTGSALIDRSGFALKRKSWITNTAMATRSHMALTLRLSKLSRPLSGMSYTSLR